MARQVIFPKTQNFNFWSKLNKFDENFDEITKFEVLIPKIQNLAKSQNLRSLTLKSKIFDFDKIWPKIKIPPQNLTKNQNYIYSAKQRHVASTSRCNFSKFQISQEPRRPDSSQTQRAKTDCFKNFLQNFGDESQFWWFWDFGIDFKILKKVGHVCSPILRQILENFDFRILLKSQSCDKPPWRNFDFLSNFVEIENFGF